MLTVHNSKFTPNPFGDGGSKRTAQIVELLRDNDINYIDDSFILPKSLSPAELLNLSFRAFVFIGKSVGWKRYPSLKSKINAIKYIALRLPVIYDKYVGQDVTFIWESTISGNYGYPYLMKAAGARIVAFPHNLESLVPTQIDSQTKKEAPAWLLEEIERLSLCDTVYAISKEECWLLRQFGINASYLPYYPPREAKEYFIGIRDKRESRSANEKHKFLLLGSATNPPTRNGMQKLVNEAARRCLDFDLYIAGYQTETLNIPDNDNIHFLGTLSKEELEKSLILTDAILIYQPPTSGALTRIPEMLISGIPVFANFDAARNYHNIDDVTVFQSFDELFAQLGAFRPHQASMPDCSVSKHIQL